MNWQGRPAAGHAERLKLRCLLYPPKADIDRRVLHVSFGPNVDLAPGNCLRSWRVDSDELDRRLILLPLFP